MSSSGSARGSHANGQGRGRDTYEPEQANLRNIAARDGYEANDRFDRTQPQFWPSQTSGTAQSSYLNGSDSYGAPRRRSSTGAFPDSQDRSGDKGYSYGDGDYDRVYNTTRRNPGPSRGREYVPDDYTDSEENSDFEEDRRGRDERAVARHRDKEGSKSDRTRSKSRIRQKISDMFGGDDDDMGTGNSETKKWAATFAGAVAGGFAGRTAKKDHWVPTALGALVGGMVAREAEKMFYVNKDVKEQEKMAYEGKVRSKSHER